MKKSTRYVYIKKETPVMVEALRKRKLLKLFSFLLIGGGMSLVFYVVLPILTWQLFYAPTLASGNMLSPIPRAMLLEQTGIGSVLADATGRISFGANLAYASNWFPTGNPTSNIHKEY